MIAYRNREEAPLMTTCVRHAILGVTALLAASVASPAAAAPHHRAAQAAETVAARPAGTPLMAVISLSDQRVTIYDADGWILRAPVSSGQSGRETPAGIFSVLQKEVEHHSNLYDDASMPYMQRITWSGIAMHAGKLPGYPASHGCVRMPSDFAEHLYDLTKVGMRVIIARNDVQPVTIEHPLLFKPKLVPADLDLKTLAAHWSRAETPATPPETVSPATEPQQPAAASPATETLPSDAASSATDSTPPNRPAAPLVALTSIAAAQIAAANVEAKKADAARLTAAKLTSEAARLVRMAEAAKLRAEAQLRSASAALDEAVSPAAIQQATERKTKASAKLTEAEAQLAAAQEEAPQKAEAAAHAREEADAAAAEKLAAMDASKAAARMLAPVSVFISRKSQRLYIRQSFQPVFESPVTIREPGRPIGTHIYTALDSSNSETGFRWSAVSMEGSGSDPAKAALDRIEIPQDLIDRISEVISPGSSLIISDEGASIETGDSTDFVIIMSGEPQGGIKMRHHTDAHTVRYERQNNRAYGRAYDGWNGRAPAYPRPYESGGFFGPW
jgi:L,D-transpeptidase catalytic domain